jgi:hypothetical protein
MSLFVFFLCITNISCVNPATKTSNNTKKNEDFLIDNGFFTKGNLYRLISIYKTIETGHDIKDKDLDLIVDLLKSGPVSKDKVDKVNGDYKLSVIAFLNTPKIKHKMAPERQKRIFDLCKSLLNEKNEKISIVCLLIMRSTGDPRFPDLRRSVIADPAQSAEIVRVASKMKESLP